MLKRDLLSWSSSYTLLRGFVLEKGGVRFPSQVTEESCCCPQAGGCVSCWLWPESVTPSAAGAPQCSEHTPCSSITHCSRLWVTTSSRLLMVLSEVWRLLTGLPVAEANPGSFVIPCPVVVSTCFLWSRCTTCPEGRTLCNSNNALLQLLWDQLSQCRKHYVAPVSLPPL